MASPNTAAITAIGGSSTAYRRRSVHDLKRLGRRLLEQDSAVPESSPCQDLLDVQQNFHELRAELTYTLGRSLLRDHRARYKIDMDESSAIESIRKKAMALGHASPASVASVLQLERLEKLKVQDIHSVKKPEDARGDDHQQQQQDDYIMEQEQRDVVTPLLSCSRTDSARLQKGKKLTNKSKTRSGKRLSRKVSSTSSKEVNKKSAGATKDRTAGSSSVASTKPSNETQEEVQDVRSDNIQKKKYAVAKKEVSNGTDKTKHHKEVAIKPKEETSDRSSSVCKTKTKRTAKGSAMRNSSSSPPSFLPKETPLSAPKPDPAKEGSEKNWYTAMSGTIVESFSWRPGT